MKPDPQRKEETMQTIKDLSLDALDEVVGGGNPFQDVPRVPTNPIDDELRENG